MSEHSDAASGTAAANPHAVSVRRLANAMLRTALVPGLVTVAAGAVIAGLMAGSAGVYGALVGGGIGFASSLLTIVLMRWSADLPVMIVMAVALGGYVLKLMVLLAVMILLGGVAWLHVMSLALTFLATILVWAGAEVAAFKRTKIPTLIMGGE